jgi:hypothetical protein
MTDRAGTLQRMRVALLAVCALAACECQAAAEVALPTVDFVAESRACAIDFTGAAKKETCLTVSTHYTPQRWRTDSMMAGTPDITAITDIRERTITTINYEAKTQSVRKYDPKHPSDIDEFLPHYFSSSDRVGEEVVGGRRTLKYSKIMPGDYEKVIWLSDENVVVRSETTTRDSNRKVLNHYTMEVTKLSVGAFDPSLLKVAVPADFERRVID